MDIGRRYALQVLQTHRVLLKGTKMEQNVPDERIVMGGYGRVNSFNW